MVPRQLGQACPDFHRQGAMGDAQGHMATSQTLSIQSLRRAKARRLQQVETPSKGPAVPGRRGAAYNTALGWKSDSFKDETRKRPNPCEHFALPSGKFAAVFKSQQPCREPHRGAPWGHLRSHPLAASHLRQLPVSHFGFTWSNQMSLLEQGPVPLPCHSLMNAAGWLGGCSASGGGKTLDMAMSTMPWHSSA